MIKVNYKNNLEFLRKEREKECFSVINRGKLWYNRLTTSQMAELDTWYQAWLDVTETGTIPVKPIWLNSKINNTEVLY